MLRDKLTFLREFCAYWRLLMKEAFTASEAVSGATTKVFKVAFLLIPAGAITTLGLKKDFSLADWIYIPASAIMLWVLFLMIVAAFKKHKGQEEKIKALEDEKSVKLRIEKITCQYNGPGEHQCRVTIRNLSASQPATNVHVRMSGTVVPNVFIEGHSPFNEPDLTPAGSRDINPDSESDWLFSESFNHLIRFIHTNINLPKALFGTPEREQVFTISASAANSPPAKEQFQVKAGTRESGPEFYKKAIEKTTRC